MTPPAVEPGVRPRLPSWLRMQLPTSESYQQTRSLLDGLRLHTVCESARCPNHWECWSRGTATFMIAGDHCTRACGFCAVTTARPRPLDPDEPGRVAEAVRRMKLRHVVITAVARDDLADGGAAHFGDTLRAVRSVDVRLVIEVLVPDFNGSREAIATVVDAAPQVFNHNLETVRRLTPAVRHRATYDRSLRVLAQARGLAPAPALAIKSGLMLGLGERPEEVWQSMTDLRRAGCDILTLGQYLQPTPRHLPVVEYLPPDQFDAYRLHAVELGFRHVASGPKVRSSYHAEEYHP
jgi:lipoyl synthase